MARGRTENLSHSITSFENETWDSTKGRESYGYGATIVVGRSNALLEEYGKAVYRAKGGRKL